MKRFMYLLFFVLLAGVTYAQQAKYVRYILCTQRQRNE